MILLTPEQVARKLQVKERTVSSWLKAGRLKGIKVGRLWRVPEESFHVFLTGSSSRSSREIGSGARAGVLDDPDDAAGAQHWDVIVAEQWADELADKRQDIYTLADGEPLNE